MAPHTEFYKNCQISAGMGQINENRPPNRLKILHAIRFAGGTFLALTFGLGIFPVL